jgi:hypothetical protein
MTTDLGTGGSGKDGKPHGSFINYLLDREPEIVAETRAMGGEYCEFAVMAFELMHAPIRSIDGDGAYFVGAWTSVRKACGLALMSALKRHRVQTGMNLRQAIEGVSLFAYLASHPGGGPKWKLAPEGWLKKPEDVLHAAFDWMKVTYPVHNGLLHQKKNQINRTTGHANIENSADLLDYEAMYETGRANHSFFDQPNEAWTALNFYEVGHVTSLALDVLMRVSTDTQLFTMAPHLPPLIKDMWQYRQLMYDKITSDAP